jgi:hypothetical protein
VSTLASPASSSSPSPFALAEALDHCAKWWWGSSLIAKVGGFLIGASIGFLPPEPVPFIVAALTLVSELCLYRSDAIKSTAQQFRRKLDLQDGLGWQIPNTDLSDLKVQCSSRVKHRARTRPTEPYFASTEPAGPIRALKNVSESAWWTKHLSRSMAVICRNTVIGGSFVSFVSLIVTLEAASTHTSRVNVARIVTNLLMLFLSLGLIKLAIGYNSLNKSSASSEAAAERALQTTPEELAAFKVMYDYHLNRAVGPLIPTWIWKMHRDELNHTWREHRNDGNEVLHDQ